MSGERGLIELTDWTIAHVSRSRDRYEYQGFDQGCDMPLVIEVWYNRNLDWMETDWFSYVVLPQSESPTKEN